MPVARSCPPRMFFPHPPNPNHRGGMVKTNFLCVHYILTLLYVEQQHKATTTTAEAGMTSFTYTSKYMLTYKRYNTTTIMDLLNSYLPYFIHLHTICRHITVGREPEICISISLPTRSRSIRSGSKARRLRVTFSMGI